MDQPEDTSAGFLPNYTSLMLSNFKEKFRGKFDVYLCAEEQRFEAHRIVLAASSEYFHKMFSNHFKESREREIRFNLEAESLKIVIDYIYSGKIELPDENIEGVFEAAHLFQYDKICHYITEELPVIPRNCISLLKLSELYSLYELNAKALNYIIPNFSKVWYREKFLNIDLETFKSILQSDDLEVYYEEEIFMSVRNWINYDRDNRVIHMTELLKLVRLHLLPPEFILKEVQPFCENNPEISEFISDAYEAVLMPEKMETLSPRRKYPHTFQDTIIVFCREQKILNIYKLSMSKTRSHSLHMSTDLGAKIFGVASIDDTIIMVGGYQNDGPPNQVNWINLKTKKMVLASLLPVRYVCYRVGIIVNENKSNSIYLTGDQINCGVANSVPIWNSKIRIWNPVADMINKRLNFGSTLLNKKLYVVGGINENEEYLNSMDMYDPTTNTWSECSPMVTKRRNPGVGAIDNYLFAIGGGVKNKNEYDTTVERYDSSTDTWCFVKSIPVGSDDPKVAECSNRSLIVACGNAVYQYMQGMDEWFFVTKLPDSLNCMNVLSVKATI